MTPGLAGFIASGHDAHTSDEIVAGVLDALGTAFDVVPDRGGRPAAARRRNWLDTFDWRLHRAGLTLEYAGGPRGGELLLSGDAVGTVIAQPVNGWQATRPHLTGELPSGPVTSRIADLVIPRALLPVVTVTSTTTTHRLLNEDGKTVARLLIERASVPGPQPTALAPRLAIAEVRGYPGAARTATRLVGEAEGVEPAATPTETEALRATGRRPGDYTNKVDAVITAAQPASRSAATILLLLLDTIEANTGGVLADTDTEFLHDLRVSVRRTRSALKLFGDALSGRGGLTEGESAFFAAEFKWVGDLTTPTRDLDVHLLDFDDTAHSLAAAKPDDLEPFRAYLEQRRRKEFRLLVRGLRSARFTGMTRDWRDRLTAIAAGNPGTRAASARSGRGRAASGDHRQRWRWSEPARPLPRPCAGAPRSPPSRPPRPSMTCASEPRSCVTRWSSSPPCTTRRPRPRWSASSSGCRTAWASSRTPRCRSGRSGRWRRRCWRRARRPRSRCWQWAR